jgi:hypothetical protein
MGYCLKRLHSALKICFFRKNLALKRLQRPCTVASIEFTRSRHCKGRALGYTAQARSSTVSRQPSYLHVVPLRGPWLYFQHSLRDPSGASQVMIIMRRTSSHSIVVNPMSKLSYVDAPLRLTTILRNPEEAFESNLINPAAAFDSQLFTPSGTGSFCKKSLSITRTFRLF